MASAFAYVLSCAYVSIAYHDGADESWYHEEHAHDSTKEEAEGEPDYGEDEVVRSMGLVSDDNWRWSWLRRDHNHILERKKNKGGWPDKRLMGLGIEGERGAGKKGNCS